MSSKFFGLDILIEYFAQFCFFSPIFLVKWSHNAYKREIKEILIHWFISIGSAAGRQQPGTGSRQPPGAAHRKTWNVVII